MFLLIPSCPFFISGTDNEGNTVTISSGQWEKYNIGTFHQWSSKHLFFSTKALFACRQAVLFSGIPSGGIAPASALSPCLWVELRMCLVPSCAGAQFCTFINILINMLDCEWKDLLAHIHSCHVCCGFGGCSHRETVAAGSQQEWEHVSAIKLYQKKMQQGWKCLGWYSRILIWLSHSVPRGF